jgi:hypothetical protein
MRMAATTRKGSAAMIDHRRRLLSRAALEGRIILRREPDRAWPGDHSRLCALANDGDLAFLGEEPGPQPGGASAAWRITERGRMALGESRLHRMPDVTRA